MHRPTAAATSAVEPSASDPAGTLSGRRRGSRSRGQVLVIFVMSLLTMITLSALVIDISWYWLNTLRVQRAADAAALAGVVSLPGDITAATNDALGEAGQNGYTSTSSCTAGNLPATTPGICVYLEQANDRQLNVAISAVVGTFFMRLAGVNQLTATRVARAQYELPVPMGSPLAYYGTYQLCSVTGTCSAQADAVSGTIASQGFFGAIEGEGSNSGTGDAFAPYYDNKPGLNDQYNEDGYDYTVYVPGTGATVWIYDPTFCATVTKTSGTGHAGAGDHWLGPNNPTPSSTYYQLWNTNNLPLKPNSWTKVADSGSLFQDENQVDESATYGNNSNSNFANYADQGTPSSPVNCAAGAIASSSTGGYWHNKWWPLAANVSAGTYHVRVTTTKPGDTAQNLGESFENMFSLEVTGGASGGVNPQVYGNGRMETYANIDSGTQTFYLAQISRQVGAGKTLEIDLFDPGDVNKPSWLQILSPDGSIANNYASFSWTTDANATGNKTGSGTCLQTYGVSGGTPPSGGNPPCTQNLTSGATFFQDSWVRILITLPTTYGSTGLQPSGDPAPGWWKIKYTVASANDTTTWLVSVRGNPVHLIVP